MTTRNRHTGLVMVKPHAFEQELTPVVADILDNGKTAEYLGDDDPLQSFLGRIETQPAVIRNLRTLKMGESLLDLFYGDKRDRRYFPLIMEIYLGKAAFLPYTFNGDSKDLPRLYSAMKGTAETFDTTGNTVTQATGVRGLLSEPYQAVDKATLLLDDKAYRERCLPMIDNIFHVCDEQPQIDQALEWLEDGGAVFDYRHRTIDILRA